MNWLPFAAKGTICQQASHHKFVPFDFQLVLTSRDPRHSLICPRLFAGGRPVRGYTEL
jgi:hypothetical protein